MNSAAPPLTTLEKLAPFVASGAVSLSHVAQATIRNALIDTLGCIVAGASSDVATKTRAATEGRVGSVPVFGTATCRAPEAAAFLNGVAGHVLDFDDWESPGNTHPSSVMFSAVLAACEGRTVSGHDLAIAYAVGFEVIARLGEAINYDHYEKGWHATATLGAIGAAAAVARLWHLNENQCRNAMAICVSRAAGFTAQFGSDTKPLQAGFAAESGLISATLAAHDLAGQAAVLDGENGYIALTAHTHSNRLVEPFKTIGVPLAIETYGLAVKAYPSCGYTHRIIDCALLMRDRHALDINAVQRIEVHLPELHANILPFKHPRYDAEARFSLPFCMALALIDGAVRATDFTAATWSRQDITDLMDRTDVFPFSMIRPHLNYDPEQPDRLLITQSDGTQFETTVAYPLGAPECPMSSDQILQKFRLNVSQLAISEDAITLLVDWLSSEDILSTIRQFDGRTKPPGVIEVG